MLPLLALADALAHVPLDVGDWTITEIHAGPAEAGGQWFEVRNNDDSDGSNLIEQGFRDANGFVFTVDGPLVARAGEYVVLAARDSTAEADFVYSNTFVISAEAGSVTLVDHTSGDIDTVAWTAGWGLPLDAAFALNPGQETSAWANDLLANWCGAAASPGAQNGWCLGSDQDDDGDGASEQAGDCDDGDPTRAAGAPEVACDGQDQDCDGLDTCAPDSGADTGADTGGDSAPPDSAAASDSGATKPTHLGCSQAPANAAARWPGLALLVSGVVRRFLNRQPASSRNRENQNNLAPTI